MDKKLLKILSLIIAVMLIGSLLAGCGQKPSSDNTLSDIDEDNAQSGQGDKSGTGKISDKPITFTYYAPLWGDKIPFKSMGEMELYKELEKRTGIHIEFKHPPIGQETEQFNLMIASGEYPDIIEYNFSAYPGGPEKAFDDKVIIKLNDLIDKYSPNFKKILNSDEKYDKSMKTDNGDYYGYPFIRGDESLKIWFGPQFRKDWLDDLGLQVPETIDDWYTVLKAFKEKKNAIPFTFVVGNIGSGHVLPGAWGVAKGFYMDNGEIKFGQIEPGWKEFLATMNKWYKEGLIDPDFAAQDGKTMDSKITSGKAGAFLGAVGGGMGRYITLMKDKDPKFKLIGGPSPSLAKGGKNFGYNEWGIGSNVSISTACKNAEEAAMWLDYGYSPEGNMLMNFGIEGKSYNMVDGYPKYTEEITNNPDGLPMSTAMGKYMRGHGSGPFVQRKEYLEQFMQFEEQLEAVNVWRKADASYLIPPLTPTAEESGKLAKIMAEVNTYVDEMMVKFIMGQVDLDTFDQYVQNVKNMNIDEALKIQGAALERFNKR